MSEAIRRSHTPEATVGRVRVRGLIPGLIVVSLVFYAALLSITSYMNFFYDEWDFVSYYRPKQSTSIWLAHNEHWSTFPILVWKLLLLMFGLRSHIPFEAALLAFHVLSVFLLFALVRRRSGDIPAFLAAVTLLMFGSGGTDIVWAFQIGFVASVAFGLAALLLIDGSSKWVLRAAAASIALIGSLTSSGNGLAFFAAAGVQVISDRRQWRMLVTFVPPSIAYGVWFLTYGRGQPGSPGLSADLRRGFGLDYVSKVADFVVHGLASAAGGVFGSPSLGAAILPLVTALIAVHWYRQRSIKSWQLGLSAGILAQFTLTGLVRAQGGVDQASESRYLYVAAAFLLPLIADAARELPWRGLWKPGLAVVFALSLVGNLTQLRDRALIDPVPALQLPPNTQVMQLEKVELQTAQAFRGAPDASLYAPLDPMIMPQLVAARFDQAVDESGSPVQTVDVDSLKLLPREGVNKVMLNLFGSALTFRQGPVPVGMPCRLVDSGSGSAFDFQMPAGGRLVLQAEKGGQLAIFLWYLGNSPNTPLRQVPIPPQTPEWLYVPDTGQQTTWQVRLVTTQVGVINFCGPSSTQLRQTVNYKYRSSAATGVLGPGWTAVADQATPSHRAAKLAAGTSSGSQNTFGTPFSLPAASYDVWFRIKTSSGSSTAPEVTLGLWDDTAATLAGGEAFRPGQIANTYAWVKVAANTVPTEGHFFQYQARVISSSTSDWYIDEALVAPAGSTIDPNLP